MTTSAPSLLAQASTGAVPFHLPQITIKLDRDNFSLWQSTITQALEAFDLESFILHPNPPPTTYLSSDSEEDSEPEPKINPTYTLWKKRDKLVLLWIKTTISPQAMALIT